jgi:hypothetical protein
MPAYQQGKVLLSGGGQFGAAQSGQFAPACVVQNERRGMVNLLRRGLDF